MVEQQLSDILGLKFDNLKDGAKGLSAREIAQQLNIGSSKAGSLIREAVESNKMEFKGKASRVSISGAKIRVPVYGPAEDDSI